MWAGVKYSDCTSSPVIFRRPTRNWQVRALVIWHTAIWENVVIVVYCFLVAAGNETVSAACSHWEWEASNCIFQVLCRPVLVSKSMISAFLQSFVIVGLTMSFPFLYIVRGLRMPGLGLSRHKGGKHTHFLQSMYNKSMNDDNPR